MEKTLPGFMGKFVLESDGWWHYVGATMRFKPSAKALKMLSTSGWTQRYAVFIEPGHVSPVTGGRPFVVWDTSKGVDNPTHAQVARYKTLKGATKKCNDLNGLT